MKPGTEKHGKQEGLVGGFEVFTPEQEARYKALTTAYLATNRPKDKPSAPPPKPIGPELTTREAIISLVSGTLLEGTPLRKARTTRGIREALDKIHGIKVGIRHIQKIVKELVDDGTFRQEEGLFIHGTAVYGNRARLIYMSEPTQMLHARKGKHGKRSRQ